MTESDKSQLGWEQRFNFLAKLHPGEGVAVMLFCSYGFLVMFCYYMLKTLREPLLLAGSSAEVKSYATALISLVLLFVVPLYGLVFRHVHKKKLSRWLTVFLLLNLLVFYMLGQGGVDIGFGYFVWVGIFSVLITAQFWAFATDTFNVKSGQRLFPLIMAGVSIGGLLGPSISGFLFSAAGPFNVMLLAALILLLTLPLVNWSRNAVPSFSSTSYNSVEEEPPHILGGFAHVVQNRYLLQIALLVVLLNWVNSTGEYILSEMVIRFAEEQIASNPALDKGQIIAGFYGNFFSIVNALSLLIQIFLVSRIFNWLGVQGALLILPIVAFIGYGMILFIPIFSIIKAVKILENSTDYSLMNTVRQALFLPLNESEKYQSKIAIDTFFWRFGDLIQAVGIYLGLNLFGFQVEQFAVLNMCLSAVWIFLVIVISKQFVHQRSKFTIDEPPILVANIQTFKAPRGQEMELQIPLNTFVAADVGDVISYSLRAPDSKHAPEWLKFDSKRLLLSGIPPKDLKLDTWLILRATNMDGGWSETRFRIEHRS